MTTKKVLKSKSKSLALAGVLAASAVTGNVSGGEVKQAGDKAQPTVLTTQAVKQAPTVESGELTLSDRIFEETPPPEALAWCGEDAIFEAKRYNMEAEHFPRSGLKAKHLWYDQILSALNQAGQKLFEEFGKVYEYTYRKLFAAYPDTRKVKFKAFYYNPKTGDAICEVDGVRKSKFHFDMGHQTHEPTVPRAITERSRQKANYNGSMESIEKLPWGRFVLIANGNITNNVTTTIKGSKAIYTLEQAAFDDESKTSSQEKTIVTVYKNGNIKVKSVIVHTDQSTNPQTASVEAAFGKVAYQIGPDGRVTYQAVGTLQSRELRETPCWGMDKLVKRFIKPWAKKVKKEFVLPYPTNPSRYHSGAKVATQAAAANETQALYMADKTQEAVRVAAAEKKLRRQVAEAQRLQGHKVKFYNKGHQRGA